MSGTQTPSKGFVECLSCGSVFVSEERADGTVRPIGVSEECTCGDGDFRRIG